MASAATNSLCDSDLLEGHPIRFCCQETETDVVFSFADRTTTYECRALFNEAEFRAGSVRFTVGLGGSVVSSSSRGHEFRFQKHKEIGERHKWTFPLAYWKQDDWCATININVSLQGEEVLLIAMGTSDWGTCEDAEFIAMLLRVNFSDFPLDQSWGVRHFTSASSTEVTRRLVKVTRAESWSAVARTIENHREYRHVVVLSSAPPCDQEEELRALRYATISCTDCFVVLSCYSSCCFMLFFL